MIQIDMDTPRIGLLLKSLKESGRPVTAVLLPTIYTRPRTATWEPSVTMNGSMDVNATKSPFTAPTTQQMITEIRIAAGRFVFRPYNPSFTRSPQQVPPRAAIDSIERSNVPFISGNANAHDRIP